MESAPAFAVTAAPGSVRRPASITGKLQLSSSAAQPRSAHAGPLRARPCALVRDFATGRTFRIQSEFVGRSQAAAVGSRGALFASRVPILADVAEGEDLRARCSLFGKVKGLVQKVTEQVNDAKNEADKKIGEYSPILTNINILGEEIGKLSDDELRAKTAEFKKRAGAGEDVDKLLPEAYAVVREAAERVLGLRHYDVQILGGIMLHFGQIAEMATGEGKTLVATLPSYLNALTGRGVHVVTVNDYLARRDAELMGQVHRWLGLSVGLIQAGMSAEARRAAYACDITYGTNSELGFDYLRDNMAMSPAELVQRPFNFCIVDEADSILIDEARTPLILSTSVPGRPEKYKRAREVAVELEEGLHYEIKEKNQLVTLTEQGFPAAENLLGVSSLYEPSDPWAQFVINAIKAKELYTKDKNYLVKGSEVIIIDEFTGRAMPGRRWGDGLHQSIEAKEGVPIQNESRTLASISYQAFFKLYPRLSGMTGTAATERVEFDEIYDLPVTPIPTNLPNQRKDFTDVVFKTTAGKYRALVDEVSRMHEQGRPVLVGTTSVETSDEISALLSQAGLEHEVLNARPDVVEREAQIVAQAGRKGAITIATNMAGRGTDILLGGNADYLARLACREAIMPAAARTERDWSVGGEVYPIELSKETRKKIAAAADAVVKSVGGKNAAAELEVEELIARSSERLPAAGPAEEAVRAAFLAAREEFGAFCAAEREAVLAVGGLHVIGTERHESRRIDNQLRGRSARQGDPGSTRFLLALEDNLFRLFGGERVEDISAKFNVDEYTPIESDLLATALDRAQSNVEKYFFDTRKTLYEYDGVLGEQRTELYETRRRILTASGDERRELVEEWVEFVVESIVRANLTDATAKDPAALEKTVAKVRQFVPNLPPAVSAEKLRGRSLRDIEDLLCDAAVDAYEEKEGAVEKGLGRAGFMGEVERFLALQQLDTLWCQHMVQMKFVQEEVGLAVVGGKDPMVEYRTRGAAMFQKMLSSVKLNTVYSLFMYNPTPQAAKAVDAAAAPRAASASAASASAAGSSSPAPKGKGPAKGKPAKGKKK